MNLFYAGVGSRKTPPHILDRMRKIADSLMKLGWTLRTGGAEGADQAFIGGLGLKKAFVWTDQVELYLPWQGFCGHHSRYYQVSEEAMSIAKSVIPHWPSLNRAARLLHGRNAYQVLGYDLKTPAKMVICWTRGGKTIGGTATAIRLAEQRGIPIYNLALLPNDEWLTRLQPNGFCSQ